MLYRSCFVTVAAGLLMVLSAGCGGGDEGIRVVGSDTMVNLAHAWAEDYRKQHPDVSVQVQGGGSGVGIASLIEGVCDLANSSREMEQKEKDQLKANRDLEAKQHIVGRDALAVYVHKDNPLESISLEELAEIYAEDGTITQWSQLGVAADSPGSGEIRRVGRQNSSGTFYCFREVVLGEKREFKQGVVSMNGSKDVVALVARTPRAIGYSGMGYATDDVKMLKVSAKRGEPGVAPTVENAQNGSYPITRPLWIYTAGEPNEMVRQYLDWILSAEGQKVVRKLGYVPVSKDG